jgi:hypothetical protein
MTESSALASGFLRAARAGRNESSVTVFSSKILINLLTVNHRIALQQRGFLPCLLLAVGPWAV